MPGVSSGAYLQFRRASRLGNVLEGSARNSQLLHVGSLWRNESSLSSCNWSKVLLAYAHCGLREGQIRAKSGDDCYFSRSIPPCLHALHTGTEGDVHRRDS